MRLLKVEVIGTRLFKESSFGLDLVATDRVPRADDETPLADVSPIPGAPSIFSQNIVGISGVNASGKTTTLNLLRLALDLLAGEFAMRSFRGQQMVPGKLEDEFAVSSVFWHEGSFYLIETHLIKDNTISTRGARSITGYAIGDETLWHLNAKRVNRKMITDIDVFKSYSTVLKRRRGNTQDSTVFTEQELALLGSERSIASLVTGKTRSSISAPSRTLPLQTLPAPVVQAFDPSIECLEWDNDDEVYTLKFKGEQPRIVNESIASALLSRGTIYGVELVNEAIEELRCGGYLLVDEIEEAINRSLVATIIDLFASPITNPYGAQLIFTTHYPEILDALHRKDNVYLLVRNDGYKAEAVKYSTQVSRIENKKSEVVLSNLIKGTMPRYPDVRAMRQYVRERVHG